MKIKEIALNNFKRFTHLRITGLADTVKLVVLLGPNGCGKSSVFDALYLWAQRHGGIDNLSDDYCVKMIAEDSGLRPNGTISALVHGTGIPRRDSRWRTAVYPRTAYRNVPSFEFSTIQRVEPAEDERRIAHFIDNDAAADKNYLRLIGEDFRYARGNSSKTPMEYRQETEGVLAAPLKEMFGDLVFAGMGDPLDGVGTFRFTKGVARNFAYKNLSGGEKAAFDLILDVIVKRRVFTDTVYCIDEPEAHMNTRLQKDLLTHLYNLMPPNCQLWIATHSIGMMRQAYEIDKKEPGAVVFLDFGDMDFDKSQTIRPAVVTKNFWRNAYDVALDDLAALVVPEQIIFCESKGGDEGFDARCYNQIFGDKFFYSGGGKGEISKLAANFSQVLQVMAKGATVCHLRDRDEMSDSQRKGARREGILVLKRRALENYLIVDEIIRRFCEKIKLPEKADDLIAARNMKIHDLEKDDAKAAAAAVWQAAKTIKSQIGDRWQNFLSDSLALLVTPETAIYRELKDDIFGNDDADPA